MRQSGLSNNSMALSKGILKKAPTNGSLAKNYGIVRKPHEQDNMGLTANFNIEDEYVENLLKQIHFMNLEVKLLKEKQEESKGKLGMAALLKDGKPIQEHIIHSQNKFKDLITHMQQQISTIEKQLTDEKRVTDVSKAQIVYQTDLIQQLRSQHDSLCQENDSELNEVRKKSTAEKKKMELVEMDINKIKQQLKKVQDDHTKLMKEENIKKMNKDLNDQLLDEQENVDKEDLKFKQQQYDQLQDRIKNWKDQMSQDKQFLIFAKENKDRKEDLIQVTKEMDQYLYESIQKEHLVKLASELQQEDAFEKKRILEEIDRLNQTLEEIVKTNNVKIERKLKESESMELKKKQLQYSKMERDLAELIIRFDKVDTNFRNYLTEMMHKNYYLKQLEEPNKELENKLQDTIVQINKQEPILKKIEQAIEQNQMQIQEMKEEKKNSLSKLRELENLNKQLQTSYDYQKANSTLDQDLKGINIDELRGMKEQNTFLNETINDFVTKWDQIKRFSKNLQ